MQSQVNVRTHTVPASAVGLEARPLRGGLEAAAVARVRARWTDATGRPRSWTFVAKRLDGSLSSAIERTLRDAYWLASVGNTLSGALHYHLAMAADLGHRTERERQTAAAAAHLHLRVVRRADAVWPA
jgi:hypothetical protein